MWAANRCLTVMLYPLALNWEKELNLSFSIEVWWHERTVWGYSYWMEHLLSGILLLFVFCCFVRFGNFKELFWGKRRVYEKRVSLSVWYTYHILACHRHVFALATLTTLTWLWQHQHDSENINMTLTTLAGKARNEGGERKYKRANHSAAFLQQTSGLGGIPLLT